MGSARWKKPKKANKNKVTQFDLQRAEKRWQEKLEKTKTIATSDATAYVYAIMFKALMDEMAFTIDDLEKLQKGIDKVSTLMINQELYIDDIVTELESKGVGFLA